jgi:UDP-2,3-diacylglucosamine hydrolase
MSRPSTEPLPRNAAALFVSDLHLTPAQPAVAQAFTAFLAGPTRAAAALYILGDLFDYWAGDDDLADPFNARIAAALAAVAAAGVAVSFLPGNRDFLVGDDFAAAAGLRLLPDPCVHTIAGTPTLLMHGDTLCTDDTEYQRFRAEVRSPAWRAAFLARPLGERKALITALRAQSENEKQVKPAAIMDANADAVAAALQRHGVRALVHGHTHRQGVHTHEVDGHACRRWVLGDWSPTRTSVLACDATGWHFGAN